jgi:hypothetical protein
MFMSTSGRSRVGRKEPFKLFVYSDVFNAHYILNHEGVMK